VVYLKAMLLNYFIVSTSFEGAFVHFRLLTCTFTSGAIMHDVCRILRHQDFDYNPINNEVGAPSKTLFSDPGFMHFRCRHEL
jgi:hypothetical protein